MKQLLISSRLRNQEKSITGMLLYDRGLFLQALEGEQGVVQSTFLRIERDTRHRDVTVLFRDANIPSRSFGEWAMGFADPSAAPKLLKGVISASTSLRDAALDKTNAVKIMKALAAA